MLFINLPRYYAKYLRIADNKSYKFTIYKNLRNNYTDKTKLRIKYFSLYFMPMLL
ncbi:hypothetical protein C2G38_2079028 [Gigaspora rosea]|uniref:Uncharacterized protein n=1 Tax=Gigaspora rosea TaxID=44941 RepID=A0A397VGQ0_9GLOM|nr:hypothetical protein C2G38_2079028 [Gigaspora rosea]